MKRTIKIAVISILGLLVLYLGGAWYFSSVLVAFKTKTQAEDRKKRGIRDLAQYGFEKSRPVEIVVGPPPGLTLRGRYLKARPGKRCGVILSHGHRATIYGSIQYTSLFSHRGCAMLLFSARHHGRSDGDYSTYGYHEKKDLHRALAWFEKETGLPRKRIGLFGVSMGAAITLQAAASMPNIAFVAVDSPFSSLRRIVSEQGRKQYGDALSFLLPPAFVLGGWRTGADLNDVRPIAYAARITVPIFILHSKTDTYTPPVHSERIFARIGHDRKVLHITKKGAAHSKDIVVDPAGYRGHMDAFLRKHAPAF